MNVSNSQMSRIKNAKAGGLGRNQAIAADREDVRETKGHLINVVDLHRRISALNPSEAQRKAIETDLRDIRQRLQYLLAISPAIIYTTKASGDYACTFVSENLRAIMGYSP